MRRLFFRTTHYVLLPRSIVAGLVCSLALSSWLAAPLAAQSAARRLKPTTTLAAETANNTSAANSFSAQGNGNVGAGNVSKMPVRQLLYAGSTTRVFVNWLPWFGGSNHINVGYRSDDPAQVHRQV